ncbi:MAG: heavy-metal-associated domain-containing protein [Myxococcales bacterium]|nr:heavy-metal-associated domain-containing protein [Myxococcales bacterium]
MTRAIESVKGVSEVTVAFEAKTAVVQSERCSPDVVEAIGEALQKAGYGGTLR